MSGIDYYRLLGVPPSATRRAIREAYLGKVRSLHPDRVGPEGTALFQQITEAYENLSDSEKRREYDRACRSAVKHRDPEPEGIGFDAEAEPLVGRQRPTSSRTAPNHSQWLDEVFQLLFGNGVGIYSPQSSADSVELQVTLTRQEAFSGVVLPLLVPKVEPCGWCGGSRGLVYRCRGCGGSGEVVGEHVVRIRIPSGVRDGSVMESQLSSGSAEAFRLRVHIRVIGELGSL
jgi:DnaJ-class molecular chaperone